MIQAYIAAAVVAAAAAGAWAWGESREEDGRRACQAEAAQTAMLVAQAAEAAASAAAVEIRNIRVQHRTVTQEVQREILERPVYRDAGCSHSPEQLQRINAAITDGAASGPAGPGLVPAAGAAGR